MTLIQLYHDVDFKIKITIQVPYFVFYRIVSLEDFRLDFVNIAFIQIRLDSVFLTYGNNRNACGDFTFKIYFV